MPFWLALLLMPLSAAGIILSALKIKKKPVKILGITLFSIVFALMFTYIILVFIMAFRADDPYDDPDPNAVSSHSQFVAAVEDMTDNGDNTYTYDDGEISLTFEKISADDMESALEEASSADNTAALSDNSVISGSVLHGESGGREWSAVIDAEGKPETVYISAGDTMVSAKVNTSPNNAGAEYTASAAAVLVTDSTPYSEDANKTEYRTDSSSFYIEEANCLLYYPAQLTAFSDIGSGYIFRDEKSSAVLKVTLTPNEYTSMSEVESFIKNTENNQVLAYGANWFTSESKENGRITFDYSSFGSRYIVEAELTYPEKNCNVFGKLQELIKCCFVGDDIWKSTASGVGYSKDKVTAYSDKFSRETAAYYSEKHGVILLYPEIFSRVDKTDEYVFFTDPVTNAEITLFGDTDRIPLSDWAQNYGFDESYIDGEHRVKAGDMNGGRYGVMYLTDTENVCAVLSYPEEYAWVYEEFEESFTIISSASEISNTEMQTVFIEEYGALITMPLQFTQTSFYDGVIRYKDGLNGMEMTVTFEYLTTKKERRNLFACFDVIADDDDIRIGDSYVSWLSNSGFFYGARGNDMKALMQIDAPNVAKAYESTLPMFSVEFVTEDSREETKAQQLAKEARETELTMSDPPEEASSVTVTTVTEAVAYPNKVLIYEPESDYTYASADGEYWYSLEQEYDESVQSDSAIYCIEQKELVAHILDILRYNNYDVDKLAKDYYKRIGYVDYDEESMLQNLTMDTEFAMYFAYKCEPQKDSDLGKGVPSVLEEICNILEIEKPDYVRDISEETSQTTAPAVTALTEAKTEAVTSQQTKPVTTQTTSAKELDRYRITDGDTSHDAEYGYNSKMAETIDMILTEYDEDSIAAYIADKYSDEELTAITAEMYTGGYDYDYGYITTLVYILANYSDDRVISAMAGGSPLPAKEAYIYFPEYDDYGTGWGEPDIYTDTVWKITDSDKIEEYELLTDTSLCSDIYDKYGDIILCLTGSSMHGEKVPFWVNNWENDTSKAAYLRDRIVPNAINYIDEYCSGADGFYMDCLSADAKLITFNAGGSKHTGIKITAIDMYDPDFDTVDFYLDINTGALYCGGSETVTGDIFG